MTISTQRYIQKPVDAIRITDENIEQVATWCHGEVKTKYENTWNQKVHHPKYIELSISHPTGRRTARAFPGDWIVSAKGTFKVYNDRAFSGTFNLAPDSEAIRNLVQEAMGESVKITIAYGYTQQQKIKNLGEKAFEITRRILDLL